MSWHSVITFLNYPIRFGTKKRFSFGVYGVGVMNTSLFISKLLRPSLKSLISLQVAHTKGLNMPGLDIKRKKSCELFRRILKYRVREVYCKVEDVITCSRYRRMYCRRVQQWQKFVSKYIRILWTVATITIDPRKENISEWSLLLTSACLSRGMLSK